MKTIQLGVSLWKSLHWSLGAPAAEYAGERLMPPWEDAKRGGCYKKDYYVVVVIILKKDSDIYI